MHLLPSGFDDDGGIDIPKFTISLAKLGRYNFEARLLITCLTLVYSSKL